MEDLDDLFTDQLNDPLNDELNAHLDIAGTATFPPGLAERLDELRLSGCTQKIAWSRIGAIACITSDKRSVRIHYLQWRPKGVWELNRYTDPGLSEQLVRFYRNYDLAHVTWSPHGTDLLIIDSCGRIALAVVFVAINRLFIHKALNCDPEDNLNALIGLKWLNMKRPISIGNAAVKVDQQWKYAISSNEAKGPWSPYQKSAFVAVTRGASLKLFYQGLNDWLEVKHEIHGISNSGDLLTHASLCTDKDDSMLVAIHTASKQLQIFVMKIDWQMPKTPEPPSNPPTISLQHVTSLDMCAPSLSRELEPSLPSMSNPLQEPELSHLMFVSRPNPASNDQKDSTPVIFGIFSPGLTSIAGAQEAHTIVARWELREEKAVIDESFSQLNTRKPSSSNPKEEIVLNKLEEIKLDAAVIFFDQLHCDTLFSVGYSSGQIEFRDRNFVPLSLEDRPDRASSLTRIGFTFDKLEPCLYLALSPHATVKASLGKTHDCGISHLQLPLVSVDPGILGQVIASFVLQHTVSETSLHMGSNPTDDLLMTMWQFESQLSEEQRKLMEAQFLKDLYRTLGILDKCADSTIDRLIRFTPLGRALSMQGALGNEDERHSKSGSTLTCKVAFTFQSLRLIALSLSFSVIPNTKSGQQTSTPADMDINKPETLQYIIPQTGWMVTLIEYIFDRLFEINRVFGVVESFDGNLLLNDAQGRSSYMVLVLMLCTVTRNFIRFNCRSLRSLFPFSMSPFAAPPSPLASLYAELAMTIRNCIIAPNSLEALLDMTDQALQEVYGPLSETQRQEIEMQLLAAGEIPPVLFPAVKRILSGPVEQIRIKAGDSEAELMFRDWSRIGFAQDGGARKAIQGIVYDGIRKVELKKDKIKLRTCLRCGGHMEDTMLGRNQKTWLINISRSCCCGGHWIIEKPASVSGTT